MLAAVLIISEFGRFVRSEPSFGLTKMRIICVILALTVAVYLIALHRHISEQQLESVVERGLPVAAVKFINEKNYSGPLYNAFGWGG
jgi:predicted subunit of tRNA(5-methylaminomethyl-2-thiouridylate) methyltransferase